MATSRITMETGSESGDECWALRSFSGTGIVGSRVLGSRVLGKGNCKYVELLGHLMMEYDDRSYVRGLVQITNEIF